MRPDPTIRQARTRHLRSFRLSGQTRRPGLQFPDTASNRTPRTTTGRHIRGHEGLPDPAGEDEAELSVDHLLVLPHQRQERVGIGQFPRYIGQIALHPHLGEVRPNAARLLLRTQPHPRRKLECERAADGHALPVQQPVGIAGRGLQRMAEGMPEVQKRPVPLLGLVGAPRCRPSSAPNAGSPWP